MWAFPWSIKDGREYQLSDNIDFKGGSFARRNPNKAMAHLNGAELTLSELEALLREADKAPTNHRDILKDQNWLNFYNAANLRWATQDKYGNAGTPITEQSLACIKCNIVLPVRAIQVDHSRPQAGRLTEAVAKFLRHHNYTKEGPMGVKGRASTGTGLQFGGGNVSDRYTLTNKGAIAFHIVHEIGGKIDEFRSACRNSYANLRPMCAKCNIGRNAGNSFNVFQ